MGSILPYISSKKETNPNKEHEMLTTEDLIDAEWAGTEYENDAGYLRYTAIHLWVDGVGICGAKEGRGGWVEGRDSNGSYCKKCLKKEKLINAN